MDRQPDGRFLLGRPAEDVETEVVPHDPGEQIGIHVGAIPIAPRAAETGWLERRPWRCPQRIHAGGLVVDLGDVTAFDQNGDAKIVVLNRRGAAAAIAR